MGHALDDRVQECRKGPRTMGRLTLCSGSVPPLFRLPGTAESLVLSGLFRRSGLKALKARTYTRGVFSFFSLRKHFLYTCAGREYSRNTGTALYPCGFRLFRVAGTEPEKSVSAGTKKKEAH